MTGTGSRFNVPIETWDAAVLELRDLLDVVARRRETVTYGAVVAQMRTISLPPDSSAFHHMLGEISERTFDEGAPLLSAVVVNKHDGKAGGGFARLARRLGFEVADDPDAEDAFWVEQLTAVHEWWGRGRLGRDASDDSRPPAGPASTRRSAADLSAGGCRAAVLDAFVRLEARDGRTTFSAGEVVQEVRQVTSAFKVSTIQTYWRRRSVPP